MIQYLQGILGTGGMDEEDLAGGRKLEVGSLRRVGLRSLGPNGHSRDRP